MPKELTLTELRHFLCGKVGAVRDRFSRGVIMDQLWITHGFYMVLYGLFGFVWFIWFYLVLCGLIGINRDYLWINRDSNA